MKIYIVKNKDIDNLEIQADKMITRKDRIYLVNEVESIFEKYNTVASFPIDTIVYEKQNK